MNLKKLLTALGALIILIALFFLTSALRDKYTIPVYELSNINQNIPTNTNQNQDVDNKYRSVEYFSESDKPAGFSFGYPADLFKKYTATVYLPYNHKRISVTDAFKHEIPIQHCALSGQCTPTTIDISFGAVYVPDSIEKIKKSELGGEIITRQFETLGTPVYELRTGVEGEGVIYDFVEWNGHTLMLYRTYIDESIGGGYKDAQDFIPFQEQTQIMDNIIGSLD